MSRVFKSIFLFNGSWILCASFMVSTGSFCFFAEGLPTDGFAKYLETFAGRAVREDCPRMATVGALFLFSRKFAGISFFCCFRRFRRSSQDDGSLGRISSLFSGTPANIDGADLWRAKKKPDIQLRRWCCYVLLFSRFLLLGYRFREYRSYFSKLKKSYKLHNNNNNGKTTTTTTKATTTKAMKSKTLFWFAAIAAIFLAFTVNVAIGAEDSGNFIRQILYFIFLYLFIYYFYRRAGPLLLYV